VSGERFLLDSHVLIWLDTGDARLSAVALERLRQSRERFLSAATAWELALKQAAGKLKLDASISSTLSAFGLLELPVSIRHGEWAARLPPHHRDPFDRLLLAQAQLEGLILVSADRKLAQYGVPILLL
jgi:PIN domain nuclease of toxin-antitoxin system